MTPAERLRKHQRALDRTQRELDRERVKLENQEKKLVQDIKKSAKNGQVGACKIQAKDLVRTRRSVSLYCLLIKAALTDCDNRYIQKFYQMRTQLQAISLRIQVCASFPPLSLLVPRCADSCCFLDCPKQRTDDAVDERSHNASG